MIYKINMILSEIKKLKNLTLTNAQFITVKCDDCGNEWTSALKNQISGFEKYKLDLCRGCKQKVQIKTGIRGKQYINAGIGAKRSLEGKTYEELHGRKKAKAIKKILSNNVSGLNNPNFGAKYSHGFKDIDQKGKTIEEIWGVEKATKMRKNYSISRSGKGNNMYGKPSPQGSGNGWSGWYNGWYFRSLKELSYMIYVIERFNLKWKTAETKDYKIEYTDYKNAKRTYHPDFLIEDMYLVEIKPKALWNSDNVQRKKEAAIEFCKKYHFKYKLTESSKQITYKELKDLIKQEKLVFIKRYQEKFNNITI